MIIRLSILFILLLFVSFNKVYSEYASLVVSDTSLLIGTTNEINITIEIPQNFSVKIPYISFPENIILLKSQIDTNIYSGQMKISLKYIITSFVEGTYIIPETKIIITNLNNNNISIETISSLKIRYLYPEVDTNRPYYNYYDKINKKKNTLNYSNNKFLYVFIVAVILLLILAIVIIYHRRNKSKENYVKKLNNLSRNVDNHNEIQLIMKVNSVLLDFLVKQIGINQSEMSTNNIKQKLSNLFENNDLTDFINIKNKIEYVLYNNGYISKEEVFLIIKDLIKILDEYY